MSERDNVTYLPWAVPTSEEGPAAGTAAPDAPSPVDAGSRADEGWAIPGQPFDRLPDGERERAAALAVKRIGQMSSVADDAAKRRLVGYLQRRGYEADTVRYAVSEAMRTRQ